MDIDELEQIVEAWTGRKLGKAEPNIDELMDDDDPLGACRGLVYVVLGYVVLAAVGWIVWWAV